MFFRDIVTHLWTFSPYLWEGVIQVSYYSYLQMSTLKEPSNSSLMYRHQHQCQPHVSAFDLKLGEHWWPSFRDKYHVFSPKCPSPWYFSQTRHRLDKRDILNVPSIHFLKMQLLNFSAWSLLQFSEGSLRTAHSWGPPPQAVMPRDRRVSG